MKNPKIDTQEKKMDENLKENNSPNKRKTARNNNNKNIILFGSFTEILKDSSTRTPRFTADPNRQNYQMPDVVQCSEDHPKKDEQLHKKKRRLEPVVNIQPPVVKCSIETVSQVILSQLFHTNCLQNQPHACGVVVTSIRL